MERLKQDFVLKGKEIYVGLEDSKKTWKLCVRSSGNVVKESSMPAQYVTLQSFFRNNFPECKIKVMYEAGFRGFNLYDELQADGWSCVVTPPHTITQEKCQSQKNDRIDCRRLAKNLETGDYRSCAVPDKQLREDRQISRRYGQIQGNIIRVCNRIRRSLEFHGLDSAFTAGAWHSRDYRELEQKLSTIEMSDSLRYSFNGFIQEMNYLRGVKKDILKKLRELAKSERYQKDTNLLKSAPGIGPLTAIRLVLEWGDVRRFKRKEQFASFLGLIPREYSSGEMEHKGHITKQGNRWVRSWLIESAWIAIKHDPVLLAKFQSVASRCGSKKKAIVAVAHKLALRLRALLLTGTPYQLGVIQ